MELKYRSLICLLCLCLRSEMLLTAYILHVCWQALSHYDLTTQSILLTRFTYHCIILVLIDRFTRFLQDLISS
jgi:hypothetical protein